MYEQVFGRLRWEEVGFNDRGTCDLAKMVEMLHMGHLPSWSSNYRKGLDYFGPYIIIKFYKD